MDKRKSRDKDQGGSAAEKIIDLANYRKNKSEQRRREYERVLFNRILGVYSFAERGEKTELKHLEIIDISFSGIKFRIENPHDQLSVAGKTTLRLYFTPASYLRIVVEVKRAVPYQADGRDGLEYGCELDRVTKSYEVIKQLVDFIQKYSEIATQDHQPPMVWY